MRIRSWPWVGSLLLRHVSSLRMCNPFICFFFGFIAVVYQSFKGA